MLYHRRAHRMLVDEVQKVLIGVSKGVYLIPANYIVKVSSRCTLEPPRRRMVEAKNKWPFLCLEVL
jgi:hypothetical protein